MEWIGIDYGSKLAGTTVICFSKGDNQLDFLASKKKKDADKMISDFLLKQKPAKVFFDAPLSLPKAYFGIGDDFFYRVGDREIGAMSPMFLGGLTARAIKLKTRFEKQDISFFEAYPGGLAKEWKLALLNYKKEKEAIEKVVQFVLKEVPFTLKIELTTWHEVDALLAFIIGYRNHLGKAKFIGDKAEGGIWV